MPDVDSLFGETDDSRPNNNEEVEEATSSSKNISDSCDDNKLIDSSTSTSILCDHDGNYSNGISRTLATVMENLPLSQDTFMHHQQNLGDSGLSESDVENLSLSDKLSVNNANLDDVNVCIENLSQSNSTESDNQINSIGHSRSAHSFGPGDYLNSDPPRRTHVRHNSYEVTGINSNNQASYINGVLPPMVHNNLGSAHHQITNGVNRTNSLSSRANDCSSYSSSSFSVSSLSCSDYSSSVNDDIDGINGSKRSSLDRRSLASFSESVNEAATAVSTNEDWKFKRLPQITSILPKVLFSRNKSSASTSSGDSNHSDNGSGCGPVDLWTLRSKLFRPSSTNSSATSNSSQISAEVPSTTALILENRPACLPPKSAEEEQKHKLLYEQMVVAAKKNEQKEAKLKKKLQREQIRQEELLSAAVKEWTNEILPKWDELKTAKRTKELWGQGLPPCVRGKVWKLAIGNDLNITEELFEICVNRAKDRLQQFEDGGCRSDAESHRQGYENDDYANESSPSSPVDRESTVELIHLDVARTFPTLGIFQKGGPYYDLLLNVLGAYVCYRPDVGYVQGMSFLAAILLLNLDASEAFVAFANLMNRPCQLAFFRLRHIEMQRYFQAYDMYFEDCLPKLHNHFKIHEIRPNLYLIEWLYTLYAKSLPLEVTCRIWDSFLRDGEDFLFKTAIGILYHFEDILIRMDFDRCVQFLTHLPDNLRDKDLFRSVEKLKTGREHKRFGQFLAELANGSSGSTTSTSPVSRRDHDSSSNCTTSFNQTLPSADNHSFGNSSNSNEQTPVMENNGVIIISL